MAMKIPGQEKPGADIMQLVYRTLGDETKGRWCMIVDSADNVDIFFDTKASSSRSRPLHQYLPQNIIPIPENGLALQPIWGSRSEKPRSKNRRSENQRDGAKLNAKASAKKP